MSTLLAKLFLHGRRGHVPGPSVVNVCLVGQDSSPMHPARHQEFHPNLVASILSSIHLGHAAAHLKGWGIRSVLSIGTAPYCLNFRIAPRSNHAASRGPRSLLAEQSQAHHWSAKVSATTSSDRSPNPMVQHKFIRSADSFLPFITVRQEHPNSPYLCLRTNEEVAAARSNAFHSICHNFHCRRFRRFHNILFRK